MVSTAVTSQIAWLLTVYQRTCTLHGRILSLRQDPSHLHYRVTWPEYQDALPTPPTRRVTDELNQDDTEELVRRYFSLNLDLGALYDQWSKSDPNFQKKAPEFKGVRILSQDAWEALICFICSSNNNISRISQMVNHTKLTRGCLRFLTSTGP